MTGDTRERDVDAYIRRLLWALQGIPQEDRLGIAGEIHSHLAESAARGADQFDRALARLGSPDLLARSYVEEYELAGAINRAAPGRLLLAMLDRAGRSLLAFFAGLGAFILYSVSASCAATAIAKLIVPGHVGAWIVDGRLVEFGWIEPHVPNGADVLGYWIVPLLALISWLAWIGATKLLRATGRRLLARSGGPRLVKE